MKILVPLADGFEEIEAVTIIDVLRRGNIDVVTAAVGSSPVTGSHGITVSADTLLSELNADEFNAIVLPGGMPGSENLKSSNDVISIINTISQKGGYIAAICAAPIALGEAGILEGKTATCYPGFENQLGDVRYSEEPVAVDGEIITGRGPGCAIPFALKLVELFKDSETSVELKKAMQVYWM